MAIGILAAVLGLLFGTAAIIIPRIVNRHNDPEDHSDSRAYLANTGRSAEEIVQGNRSLQALPDYDAGSQHAGGTDTGKRASPHPSDDGLRGDGRPAQGRAGTSAR